MEKSIFYGFSAPGTYRFIVFRKSLAHIPALENWCITNTENTTEGALITAEKPVKDQAHLMCFINTLYQNHLTIILIEKLKQKAWQERSLR